MNTDILVPVSFFLLLCLIIRLVLNAQGQKRRQWHETLQLALQKNYPIPDHTWQRFLLAVDPKRADLRKGLLFLALSTALGLIGLLAPFTDSQGNTAFLVIAIIPLVLALTYLAFWRFWHQKQA